MRILRGVGWIAIAAVFLYIGIVDGIIGKVLRLSGRRMPKIHATEGAAIAWGVAFVGLGLAAGRFAEGHFTGAEAE